MTLGIDYILSHAEEVQKRVTDAEQRVKELEQANATLREQIAMSVQLSQGAKQWWQKLGLG